MTQQEIEELYKATWDAMEKHFQEANTNYTAKLPIILNTILKLRAQGYDKVFMAGQSLYNFCLSRSKSWGLQAGQASIMIKPYQGWNIENGKVTIVYDKHGRTIQECITEDPLTAKEFWKMIDQLQREPVN